MGSFNLSPLADISSALAGNHYRDSQGRQYSFLMMRCYSEGYRFYFQRNNERVDLSLDELAGLEIVTVSERKKAPAKSR